MAGHREGSALRPAAGRGALRRLRSGSPGCHTRTIHEFTLGKPGLLSPGAQLLNERGTERSGQDPRLLHAPERSRIPLDARRSPGLSLKVARQGRWERARTYERPNDPAGAHSVQDVGKVGNVSDGGDIIAG